MTTPTLGLSLTRMGLSLLATGLLVGPLIPIAPYPRLALASHIQFGVQGTLTMVLGLLVQSPQLPQLAQLQAKKSDDETPASASTTTIQSRLTPFSRKIVFWGLWTTWLALLSEVLNAWWGARWTLSIAAADAGVVQDASAWKEAIVLVCHFMNAVGLITAVATIGRKLL